MKDLDAPLKLAKNPSTSEAELEFLAAYQGPDVRRAVALHPNASMRVRLSLLAEFPHEVLQNPSFELCVLGYLEKIPLQEYISTISSLLESKDLPGHFRQKLFLFIERFSANTIRNAASSSLLFVGQANAQDGGLHSKMLAHPDFPEERLREFIVGPVPEHRAAAARHPKAPRILLLALTELGSSDDLLSYNAANRRSASRETLERFSRDGLWPQYLVAMHSSTSEDILDRLSRSESGSIRGAVAKHENLSGEALRLLASGGDVDVLLGVAQSTKTPPKYLGLMLDLNPMSHRLKLHLAMNPATPHLSLLKLAKDADPAVRSQLTKRPWLSDDVWLRLTSTLKKSERELLSAIAASPCINEQSALFVQQRRGNYERLLAKNPRTTPSILARLRDSKDPNVRALLVEHWNTPRSTLQQIATEEEGELEEMANRHPNHTPFDTLMSRSVSLGRELLGALQETADLDPLAQRALMTFEAAASQGFTPGAWPVFSSLQKELAPRSEHPLFAYFEALAKTASQPPDGAPLSTLRAFAVASLILCGVLQPEATTRAEAALLGV